MTNSLDSRPYDLDKPDYSYFLSDQLEEVSGLTYVGEQKFLMVQDENGIVFTWDENSRQIESTRIFGSDGDYEGIELVGDQVYVAKHNGTLYQYEMGKMDDSTSLKHGTYLKGENDIEGLGYLEEEGVLLLICKEPLIADGEMDKQYRAIYAYDIEEDELKDSPWMIIDVKAFYNWLAERKGDSRVEAVAYDNDPMKKKALAPSGIAVHPISGNLYVLAHRSQLLLEMDTKGNFIHAYFLDRRIFEQAEGITFKENGDLYISSEGVEGPASLLGFTYNP
ncbi:MAG: SdiA-regulated domain-containing protein [Bacteroidota bacterium]